MLRGVVIRGNRRMNGYSKLIKGGKLYITTK
jgi:hypothetical protein